jgi:heme oxygenase
MSFTRSLYKETQNAHREVDSHPFIRKINKCDKAYKLYFDLNKLCINEIQKCYDINKIDKELYRDIHNYSDYVDVILKCQDVQKLLENCKNNPIEHAYMFYLGLLFGGQMFNVKTDEDILFVTFLNKSNLISKVKCFLDKQVKENEYNTFIYNVNNSYKLIANIFTYFDSL